MTRILIIGSSKTGKSTLGRQLDPNYRETDELYRAGIAGSDASADISHWFDDAGPWVIEGVLIPRALRKWVARNHHVNGRPCDHVIRLTVPFEPLLKGHITQAKGIETVWREVLPELLRRGVKIHTVGKWSHASEIQRLL